MITRDLVALRAVGRLKQIAFVYPQGLLKIRAWVIDEGLLKGRLRRILQLSKRQNAETAWPIAPS
jgi:hypothetical protein